MCSECRTSVTKWKTFTYIQTVNWKGWYFIWDAWVFLLLFSLIFCCIREMTIYLYKLTFPVASSVCWTVLFTASLYLMCTCISCLFCADLHSNINWSPHWLIKFSQGCQKMCVSFSDIVLQVKLHTAFICLVKFNAVIIFMYRRYIWSW